MPPGWAFPVAWTILYICLGLSLAMLIHARGAPQRGRLIGLFLVQLAINYAWSPVFFAMRDVATGLYLIGAMIALTVALIVLLMPVRKAAALLLVPYLAWLCFAGRSTTGCLPTTRRLRRRGAVPISRSTEYRKDPAMQTENRMFDDLVRVFNGAAGTVAGMTREGPGRPAGAGQGLGRRHGFRQPRRVRGGQGDGDRRARRE
jgi:hypothetical protein